MPARESLDCPAAPLEEDRLTGGSMDAKRKSRPILGWWFAAKSADGKVYLPHGDGREVKAGETLTVTGPIIACTHGLHASRRAIDALEYAPDETAVICRVRLSGEVVEQADKVAASERTVLWMADATETLHRFAIWCAREALIRERQAKHEPDPRSWAALEVKERWLNGQATTEELAAARAAAKAAAGAAAWAAARAAAKTAARDAAWVAARDAAWSAARDAQNKKLESMLKTLPNAKHPR